MNQLREAASGRERLLDVRDWVWIGVLLAVGGGLRLGTMNRESFWEDELVQLQIARGPLREIPARAAGHQQPCLDYLVEGVAVRLAGTTEVARLPAAVFGTVSLALFYSVFRRVARRPVALTASALMLLGYVHLHYSTEARPYVHLLAWVGLFWLALFRARRVNTWAAWLVVAVVGLVLLNVRGLDPVILLVACMWAAILEEGARWRRRRPRPAELFRSGGARCLLACGTALLAFIPTVYGILHHPRTLGYYWPAHLRPTWADESWGFYLKSIVAASGGLVPMPLWTFAAIGLVLLVVWVRSRGTDRKRSVVLSFGFAPEAAMFVSVQALAWCGYLVGYRLLNNGIMNPPKTAYFLFLLPGALLAAAVGLHFAARCGTQLVISGAHHGRVGTAVAMLSAVLLVGADSFVAREYLTGRLRPDWRSMLSAIDAEAGDGDLVFRETDLPFGTYEYFPSGARGVMFEKDLTVTSTASLAPMLAEGHNRSGRVFLIYSREGDTPPNGDYPAGTEVRRFHGGELIYYEPARGFLEELDGLIGWLISIRHPADPALADLHLTRAVIAERRGRRALGAFRVASARMLVPPEHQGFFSFIVGRIESALPGAGEPPVGSEQRDNPAPGA